MSLYRFSSFFLISAGSIILWGTSFLASDYFASQYIRQQAAQANAPTPTKLSPEAQKLQKEALENPNNVLANFELGKALLIEATKNQDSALIMSAVQSLSKVLELNPQHRESLLILADICFENNIMDKSIEYYAKYLELKPDDLQAKQNYALALIQTGNLDQSITALREIIEVDPKLFRPRLSLALSYRLAGKPEQAKSAAEKALPLAPDSEGKELVHRFLINIDKPMDLKEDSALAKINSIPAEQRSPAMMVNSFFQNHPIIGPKLTRITWPDALIARIEVSEFPVDQMPAFAKNKFLLSLEKNFSSLPDKIKLVLVDSATQKILLEKEVGGNGPHSG